MGNLLSKPETPLRITGSTVKSFNMWNEQWEVGALDVATGGKITDSGCIRTKDYIAVTPGTKVYLRCSAANIRPCWYNSNKAFVNSPAGLSNTVYTVPQGIYFMKFYQRVSPTTYQNDICINISQPDTTVSPHNGEYVAYFGLKSVTASGIKVNGAAGSGEEPFLLDFGQTVSLDGIGDVKDEIGAVKQSDGTWNVELVKRIGEVDLGTLTWSLYSDAGKYIATHTNVKVFANPTISNCLCSAYRTSNFSSVWSTDKIVGIGNPSGGSGSTIVIRDDSYTSATDFKSAMSGVPLVYQLATPVTTTLRTGLTDEDISYMLSLHGPVEVLGNTGAPYAQPGIYINPIVEIGHMIAGERLPISKLEGKTVKYNQLIDYTGIAGFSENGITVVNNNDGTFTVNGTATANTFGPILYNLNANRPTHKYYLAGCPSGGSTSTYYVGGRYIWNIASTNIDTGNGKIVFDNSGIAYSDILCIVIREGTTVNNLVFRPQLVDLTTIYGAGNEPTTVEQFLSDYPELNDYVAYTEGALASVEISEVNVNDTHPIPLGQTIELNGLGAIKDELKFVKQSDGTWNLVFTKRFGKVDLGTLSWSRIFGTQEYYFQASIPNLKFRSDAQTVTPTNILCVGYTPIGNRYVSYSGYDKYFGIGSMVGVVYFQDNDYDTADAFKAAKQGIQLVYELANPVTTTLVTNLTDDQVSVGKSVYSIDHSAAVLPASLTVAQLDKLTWQRSGTSNPFVAQIPIPGKPSNQSSLLCTMYPRSSINNISEQMPDKTIIIRNNNIYIKDITAASVEAFTNKIKNIIIIYQRQEAE